MNDTDLETGYEAATPVGDTLLLDWARAETGAYSALAAAVGGRSTVIDAFSLHASDTGSAFPFANQAHLVRPLPPGCDARLAQTLQSFYGTAPGGPFVLFSPWPTGDLRPYGFHLVGHPPFMVRPATPAAATPEPAESPLRVELARDVNGLATFEQTLTEAYPAEALLPFGSQARIMGDALVDDAGWRCFVGFDDARPVATAAAYVSEMLTVVEMVSTRAEHRGRGFGAAITAAAHSCAPDRPAVLVASDLGRSTYERLGYLAVTRVTAWLGMR